MNKYHRFINHYDNGINILKSQEELDLEKLQGYELEEKDFKIFN